jgi:hypothetical protein
MLIAIVMMSVVLFTFYGLIGVGVRGWGAMEGQMDVQQQPRVALGRIAAEVRQARDFVIGDSGRALGLAKVTLLAQDAAAGATTLVVEDASVLSQGRPLVIISVDRLERATVTAIAGPNITVASPLARAHRAGELIRRGQTAVSGAALAGTLVILVDDASVVQAGDLVAVGDEGPLTVVGVAGNSVTISQALAQSHPDGEIVQPLSVMFQCESGCPASGASVIRCTQSCTTAGNRVPLADLISPVPGRDMFAAVRSSLSSGVAQGATQVCVGSVGGFTVDDRVQIGREEHRTSSVDLPDRRGMTGLSGSCLNLDRGLARGYPAGAPVRVHLVEISARSTQTNDALGGQVQEVLVTTRAGLRN